MAKSLRVTFEGLCEFVIRSNQAEVYLPRGGVEHGQLLMICPHFLDKRTNWMPTWVGLIGSSNTSVPAQSVAIWSLHGQEVTFARKGATGVPAWQKPNEMLDFAQDHPTARVKSRDEIRTAYPDVGVVTLIGDDSELVAERPGPNDKFVLTKNGFSSERACSPFVHWTGEAVNKGGTLNGIDEVVNGKDEKIVLLNELHAWATVSNVAPVKDGLRHFHLHYEGIDLNGDSRMTISRKHEHATVFDCVPPVAWPTASV